MWISTASAEDKRLLLHHCLFSPAHQFVHVVFRRGEHRSTQKPNDKDAPKTTRCCAVPSCGKTVFALPFLLIPTSGKSGWILVLMKCQTVSVRTWSFVYFILPRIRLQTRHKLIWDPTILDRNVMSQHTSVSNCFHYVVTIVLSVITDHLICTEYLCAFNLNHCSIHLWRM